ncbi:MAG: S-layer homology domain-containing protein, partial [Vallitaleaceae bacterium]|nr:S-layer homology domain-containing protein [Vallitaleaceae bacterium]
YDWNEGPTQTWNTEDSLSEFLDRGGYWEYEPFDAGDGDTININSEVYYFRAKFLLNWGPVDSNGEIGWIDQYTYSQYSNTVMIGNPSYYEDASDWAVGEIEEAGNTGLIPDILLGADMKKPITREEFCELAVLLYDKIALIPSVPYPNNPFVDTQNPQILKAYQLGITKGVSETKFEPNTLINREQCATMLFRAIQAMFPEEDYEIEGVSDFPDQTHISSWAVAGTKYMYKLGIIKGDSKGNFMPKAISTTDVSIGYGMATREAAILMSIRTYNQVGKP